MSTLALNSDNDLYFVNNRIILISGNNSDEEILQRVKVRLKFFKDEWYLNSDHGIPYFQDILGTKNLDLNILDSIIREQVLAVEGIKEILETSVDFDADDRRVDFFFQATTINNTTISDNFIII